jgi:hypothetical protein
LKNNQKEIKHGPWRHTTRRGRKKGMPNRRTKARAAAVKKAAKQIEAVIPEAFKGDGHAT